MTRINAALRDLLSTMWRLEPIVRLCEPHVIVARELLTYPHLPSLDEWRLVYAAMPSIVRSLRQDQGIEDKISINIDTLQILDTPILESLEAMRDLDIVVEWTERPGATREQVRRAGGQLKAFREANGVALWIDDAGAGEDALGRIALTSPDAVKIDGELFQAAFTGEIERSAITPLIETINNSNARTIVEWIETDEHLWFARYRLGAGVGQGYLWPALYFEPTPQGVSVV